jgi:hypothetical protein
MIQFCIILTPTKRYKEMKFYFPMKEQSFLPNDRNSGAIHTAVIRYESVYMLNKYCYDHNANNKSFI